MGVGSSFFVAAFAAVSLPCERVGTTTTTTENGDLSTKAGKRRSVQSRRLRLCPGGQLGRPLQQRRLGDDESAKDQSLVFGHATASRKEKKSVKNEAEETEDNKSMELSDVFFWHDDHTDSQDWYEKKDSIGNQLAKKNVRSVACDMPGYGRSEGRRSLRRARTCQEFVSRATV